jgi:oligopeptide/dipeptide ABC transporter ATP-binding protein
MAQNTLLEIKDLKTHFFTRTATVKAVDGVNFSLNKGEVMGLVGESGSGKSVTALSVLSLVRYPGRIIEGEIHFQGENLLEKPEKEMRALRGSRVSMIFQDPVNYLDPVAKIGTSISESLMLHKGMKQKEALVEAKRLLGILKVPSPEDILNAYPFQLSGGMCQRVMIGSAIASEPPLLIADEATTALDVTVEASILRTLQDLVNNSGTTLLITTHNMRVVRKVCQRTIVMYAGRIMESSPTKDLMEKPLHPYSAGLLSCMPSIEKRGQPLTSLPGEPPTPGSPIPGCAFEPRCPIRRPVCKEVQPPLVEMAPGRWSACPYLHETTT